MDGNVTDLLFACNMPEAHKNPMENYIFFSYMHMKIQQQEYMNCKNAGIALFALTHLETYVWKLH